MAASFDTGSESNDENVVPGGRSVFPTRLPYLGALLLILFSGFLIVSAPNMSLDDDMLWLHYLSVDLFSEVDGDKLEEAVIETAISENFSDDQIARYELRQAYGGNYIGVSALWLGAEAIIDSGGAESLSEYGKRVGLWLVVAPLFGFFVFAALFVFVALKYCSATLLNSALFGLALLLLLAVRYEPTAHFVLWNMPDHALISNLVSFALNPGYAFSIFGFTPRNYFIFLALASMLLRWSGRYRISYFIIFSLSFVHQSFAGMFICIVLALDVLVRPTIFRDWRISLLGFAGVAVFLARESLFAFVWSGENTLLLAACGLGLIALLAARLALLRWPLPVSIPVPRPPDYAIDTTMLLLGWLATAPLGYALAQGVGAFEGHYFWAQIHGRLLSILEPIVVVGLIAMVLGAVGYWIRARLKNFLARVSPYPFVAVSVLVVAFHYSALADAVNRTQNHSVRIINVLKFTPGLDGGEIELREREVYFALGRAVTSDKDILLDYLDAVRRQNEQER